MSTDPRYAALKTASRGVKDILLRRTNTKLVYRYTGKIVDLETPQIVKRGEREITYAKKPSVRFVNKFVYDGKLEDADEEKEAEKALEAEKLEKEKVPA